MFIKKNKIFIARLFFILLAAGCCLLANTPSYAQVVVEATVDKPTIALDDQLVLTVKVKGGSVSSDPRMPSKGNFQVLNQSFSTHVEMINGRISMEKEYTYILAPVKEGKFEIGPITVSVEGVDYPTGPISVTVVNGGSKPARPPLPNNAPNSPPDEAATPAGDYKEVFIEAKLDKTNPYVGEQLIYNFKLYTSRNLREVLPEFPDFHDFWSENLLKEGKSKEVLGGKEYLVYQFKYALFPSKSGKLEIGETSVKAQVEEPLNLPGFFNDPFFNLRAGGGAYRPRVFRAPALSVDVKELPPNAPADFKGLVGSFALKSELSKQDLTVGETATLTLTLSGQGNLKEAKIEGFENLPNLKIYPDKADLELNRTVSGLSGKKVFKFALVPEAAGKIQIPEINLSVFNPKTGQYENLQSPAYTLSVVPGSTSQGNPVQKQNFISKPESPNLLAEDIASIHQELRVDSLLSNASLYAGLSLFLAIPLVTWILHLLNKRKTWLQQNESYLRKKKAFSKAQQKIKQIALDNAAIFADLVSKIMKEFLGDKLQRMGVSLTPQEIEQILKDKKIRPDLLTETIVFLKELEATSFGAVPNKELWKKEWPLKAIKLLKALERGLK
ncbi:MAG: protein BatD [Deltaproteobacteria bacterium]|nr:protein BatD [Deltaproteobacteria bacterium]